jgi:hypothetical protein
MFTRREVVSHTAIGALAASAVPATAAPAPQDDAARIVSAIKSLEDSVETPLRTAFQSNSLAQGYVSTLRTAFTTFLRTNNKWPDYCEVGMAVFYDVYDWHIKHGLAPEVVRVLDNRMAIKFMFTYLIVRTDQEAHIGVPYDKMTE